VREQAAYGYLSFEVEGMINVLIVDDHPIVREGLKQILKGTTDIKVAEEASNGQEALKKILESDFDVVLLDISMPGRSGLDILRELKGIKSDLHVLILSTFSEQQYAVRALKAGASGYLTKESAPDELMAAIRKVSLGGKYISTALAEKLADALADDNNKLPEEILSDREHQVMCMIASGKTVKEIGLELSLSVKTISTYRQRILEKMKMKNNAEITHYAIQRGLVH
jgi:DNA-binding NarL/FixJ family response regulator